MTFREAIQQVIDSMRHWSLYADDYFKEKYNLKDDLKIADELEEAIKDKKHINLDDEMQEQTNANT
ncbi:MULTISPECIES: hypothetical protein [unclassified Nitratiruptor]|uniref:hypothetical protein n=1 Tax=unclassified Nitratiruptor TaxID=2624044 RepID=UPI001915E3F5|nr:MULTISPECIES: hypothetical protein [unclassified Nitratiruptor]BCD59584.1 hypothetical protein NitYY0810_C0335 [Nitratiruptor sp. YY08-10]BCD63508.1 hypothetical protein NitYY0814_C0335 [Nitratiruptor sp. YY08-14]BCD83060.1 hypothetical protein NrS2_10 [Nitratiruptor phage NrS-2]BCD83126.1 hypothetical protein NrS3_10 [Nitratiruptor phage NrS-3]